MQMDRSREPTPFDEDEPFDRTGNDPVHDEPGDEYPAAQEEELELGDDDTERLPWLEGDDEDYEEGGSGQLIMFVLGGLLLLGLLVGGIWYLTRDRDGGEMVADGSLIEAPDAPYKERPADPQGTEFEGTGDSSYAVSEGQEPSAQLGGEASEQSPAPGFDSAGETSGSAPASSADAGDGAGSTAASPAASASRVGVQVGAYSSREKAEEAWSAMKGQVSALSGASYRIVEGNADIGKVYRLQALAADRGAANSLCNALKASGRTCIVK